MWGGGGEGKGGLASAAAAGGPLGRGDVRVGWQEEVARRGEETTQIQD